MCYVLFEDVECPLSLDLWLWPLFGLRGLVDEYVGLLPTDSVRDLPVPVLPDEWWEVWPEECTGTFPLLIELPEEFFRPALPMWLRTDELWAFPLREGFFFAGELERGGRWQELFLVGEEHDERGVSPSSWTVVRAGWHSESVLGELVWVISESASVCISSRALSVLDAAWP